MNTTFFRCTLLAICTLGLAAPLSAQEPAERATPVADRLENIRRSLLGDAEKGNPTRRSAPRPGTRSGERPAPRSRYATENTDVGSPREPARMQRQPAPLESQEEVPAADSGASTRRPAALVEQPDAVAPQSTRRRNPPAAEPIAETPEQAAAPSQPTDTIPVAAPKTTKSTRPLSAEPAGGVLFARKGPLLRTETIGPQTAIVGKPVSYKVRIQNLGEVAADGVVVQVQLPDWAEVISTQPTRGTVRPPEKNEAGTVMQWQLAALEGRGVDEMDMQIVLRRSQRFNLAVAWTAAPAGSDAAIEVLEPKLDLAISGPRDVLYGETKSYRLTISNPGTGDAEQVAIQLMSLDGGSQPAASQTIGTIPAGQSKQLEIEFVAKRAGANKINAVVTADSGLKAEAVEEVLVRRAGLKVEVASPPMKYAGTPCGYTIQVTNPGDAPAQKLVIEAALPSGAQQAEPSAGGAVSSDGTRVTWKIESLAPGQQQVLQLNATLQAAGANQIRVSAAAAGDLVDNGTATTNVEALADLKLEVSDPTGPVAVGDEATYEIRIKNRGTTGAAGVEAVGFFSEGIEPIRAQGGNGRVGAGQVVFQPISSLAAGSEVVLKISARASKPGNHVFRAEVRCQSLGTQLVGEETTMYYQAGGQAAHTAQRPPQPAPTESGVRPISR